MEVFELKPGDRKFALQYQLSDYELSSALLAGATVEFQMKNSAGTTVVDAAGVVIDEDGIVAYEWADGDTNTLGYYSAEFKITFSDGLIATYPSKGFIPVHITEDVPDA